MRVLLVAVRQLSTLAFLAILASPCPADDWPQWLGPQRDGVWRETGILERFPEKGPKERWRAPVGGGYAGPAVAGGKVYVADRVLPEGAKNPTNPFGRDKVVGQERVLCLDEANGKLLWTHAYDCVYEVSYAAGPRCTPLVSGGKVYTLGTMGDLLCLEADAGKVAWSKNFVKDYGAPVQAWGFSGHPLLDGNKLICLVGGEGSVAVAFDKDTGKELWKSLSGTAGYSSPVIFTIAGKRQLIVWTADAVNSLDPETGKPYWTQKHKAKQGMSIPTPRLDGDRLLVSSFYDGSLLLRVNKDASGATVLWEGKGRGELPQQTDGLHSVMATPLIKDGYIYGVCSHGELRCLKEETGERVWETLEATTSSGKPVRWANAFLVPHGDHCFLFNEHGDLILADLTPKGYKEISRTHLLEPTNTMANFGLGRPLPVVWSHPAFANRCVFARNDKEIVCVSLAADEK